MACAGPRNPRGREHEPSYVQTLRGEGTFVVDLPGERHPDGAAERTLEAMRDGADLMVQAALQDGRWFGRPDVLVKVVAASALGPWSYEMADTKLARETPARSRGRTSRHAAEPDSPRRCFPEGAERCGWS